MTTEEVKAEFDKLNAQGMKHSERMNWLKAKIKDNQLTYDSATFKQLNDYSFSLNGGIDESELANIAANL